MTTYPTGIGTSSEERIMLLGEDLSESLIGSISFAELAFWLISGTRPSEPQRKVFEAVLVSLADHGLTPTAIAARMTYYSAPESLQGAVAAGLLGGGSRFLGVTEDTARFLTRGLESAPVDRASWTDSEWDELARSVLTDWTRTDRRVPGLGHPIHKSGDPRTPVLIALVESEGVKGDRLELFEAIGRVHPEQLGKRLPLNGAGVAGAIIADLGVPTEVIRGVSLLARTAGLLGHLSEERRRPVAPLIYREVDGNALYEPIPNE